MLIEIAGLGDGHGATQETRDQGVRHVDMGGCEVRGATG